jgi:hypothetical protein
LGWGLIHMGKEKQTSETGSSYQAWWADKKVHIMCTIAVELTKSVQGDLGGEENVEYVVNAAEKYADAILKRCQG